MELFYENGAITSVRISEPRLNARLTNGEKMAFFAIAAPNQVVWAAITQAEQGLKTAQEAVALMVSEGLITQNRADEILA